ncbi:MAG: SnoaL-like domain-containing protein [Polyangiaceae bacterium]|nr:SnoaL-like domain-containing protein [Polyangiaceae bacterium]
MNRRAVLAIGAAAAVAAGYRIFVWKSDEEKIAALIDALAEALSRPEGENPALYGGRVKKGLEKALAPGAVIDAQELGGEQTDVDDVVAVAVQFAGIYRRATVHFPEPKVTVKSDRATLTGYIDVSADEEGGGSRKERRPITMELARLDGDWRIRRVSVAGPG